MYNSIGGAIYIGGERVDAQLRDVLREEARYIGRSTFWEVFNAAILDEAAKTALTATVMEQVHKAQMLKAWAFRFQEAVKLLTA